MQTSELEKKNKLTDEECINFRPSPNFKHMRKYLKSKLEESNSSPNQGSDSSTTSNSEEQESAKQTQNMAQRVNPPLPPNSPPPDSPLMVPKEEVVDEEYNDSSRTAAPVPECKPAKDEVAVKVIEKTMCRQFARGMCTRGPACIYAHELILSQLPGVYTFCKNFQNTICSLPKCKFVHATVFEKEHFYRTGYLPPHTLAHLKESNSALGPPNVLEGTPAEAAPIFSNPPPAMHPGVSTLPTSGCAPAPDGRHSSEVYSSMGVARITSPAKREWNELEMGLSPKDIGEPASKKCNNCPVTELKLQCQRSKMQTLLETKEAYAKQKAQLQKWDSKLNVVLERSMGQTMMDQLNLFMQFNSRMNGDASQKLIMKQLFKFFKDRPTSLS